MRRSGFALNEYQNTQGEFYGFETLLANNWRHRTLGVNGGPPVDCSEVVPAVFCKAVAVYIEQRATWCNALELLRLGKFPFSNQLVWKTPGGGTCHALLRISGYFRYDSGPGVAVIPNVALVGDGIAFDMLLSIEYYAQLATRQAA